MRFKPLAIQVLQQILLYAVLFWLMVSAVRAGLLLYQGQQRLEKIPATVNTLYMPLLAQSVWDVEMSTTQRVLTSISALAGIDAVALDTRLGQHLHYDRPVQASKHHNIYRLDVHLDRAGKESLGTLTLYVTNTPLQREILNDLLSSMTQRVLDFAALALLIVFILRRRFVLPVQQLAHAVRAYKPGEPSPPFRMSSASGVRDEMTLLLESFNSMRNSINSHLTDRLRYEVELTHARDQLALSVEERTVELDRLLRFQTLISNISTRFINIPLDGVDQAMDEALEQIGGFMEVDRCYLVGVDEIQVVSMVHEWAADGIRSGHEGLDFAPLASRPALFSALMREGVLNLPRCQTIPGLASEPSHEDVRSVLLIRIDYLGKPVGMFGCEMIRSERNWRDEELIQARLLGEMFANIIIRRQQLTVLSSTQQQLEEANAHLSRMAMSDSLTGLANRRHFDEEKHQAFDQARRKAEPLSLIMLDIDYFKEYNDRYGHLDGDVCLQRIARALVDEFDYPGELPARIGGEEFAILLPGLNREGAMRRAEQLRQAIYYLNIPHASSHTADRVTVSLGVVAMDPLRHQSIEQVIAEADAALYRAKASGRNCIS
jgi:diguanylate cyclase (GGDEF)-like protein